MIDAAAAKPPGPHIVALLSDLMVAVQLETPARAFGWSLATVSSATAVRPALSAEKPDLVVIDLADSAFQFAEFYQAIREEAPQARVLAFYPHVRDELAAMARRAGCELVMPRSRFFSNPAAAIESGLAASTSQHA